MGEHGDYLNVKKAVSGKIQIKIITKVTANIYTMLVGTSYFCLVTNSGLTATPWTTACQASLSFTISQSLFKLMSTESVMISNHLILCCPLLLLPSIFPSITNFSMSWLFPSSGQIIGASASVIPMNIQGWFPFRLTSLIFLLFKWVSRIFSITTIQKHQFFSTQPSLHPALTLVPDYWKNHSFNYMELCQQSDVSVFLIHCLGLS